MGKTLKGGSLEIQLITSSEKLSSYIISLCVMEEIQQYANSFIISIFRIQNSLRTLILLVAFMKESKCYSKTRLYLHYIQSVTVMATVPSSFLHVFPHILQRICYFSLTNGGTLG